MKPANKTNPQITVFYNPADNKQVKAVGHAKGTGEGVLFIPNEDAPTAYNIWTRSWDALEEEKLHYFLTSHPQFAKLVRDKNFYFKYWRNLCIKNPDLIGNAVAMTQDRVIIISRETEVYTLQAFDKKVVTFQD